MPRLPFRCPYFQLVWLSAIWAIENMKIPNRVLIIGILFCIAGATAIYAVISDLMRSHINVNFAVLMLPVGIGLLKGKARSQWWAGFWFILGYIGCAAAVILSFTSGANARAILFGRVVNGSAALPYFLAIVFFVVLVLAGLHVLLFTPKAKVYFQRER